MCCLKAGSGGVYEDGMTKADIIRAAFKVWGREFYLTTSLTGIARELGVSKTALYRHFTDKQALLNRMYEWFFEDYAASVKADYDRALAAEDPSEGLFIMTRAISAYYGRNRDAFIFSLIKVYGSQEVDRFVEYLRVRGIDMKKLQHFDQDPGSYPSIIQLSVVTMLFWVAYFHRFKHKPEEPPPEVSLQLMIVSLEALISKGLGFNREVMETIDYEVLERQVAEQVVESLEQDELLQAVAGAVAEAGPWNASMYMVARRSGLSKSGLYAHFKSKQDMLRQLFLTELDRMTSHAETCAGVLAAPEERFYLVIIAIANYLRCRPEILIALDWVRIRRFDVGLTIPIKLYRLFADIRVPLTGEEKGEDPGEGAGEQDRIAQWILFLIINILMHRPARMEVQEVANTSFRLMHRFIGFGLRGFIR
jgi:AcrR family transcriptional regulator